MMRLRLTGLVAAAFALVPVFATASDQEDALRLAQRLASPGGLSTATVLLHATPKTLPSSIPLPKATLLGSVAHDVGRNFADTGAGGRMILDTTVVQPVALYYDAPNRDATVKAYEDSLRAAGWKRVDAPPDFPFPRGGFAMQFPRIISWCSPGKTPMAIAIQAPPGDVAALDVDVSVGGGPLTGMQCGRTGDAAGNTPFAFFDMLPKSPLPTFAASSGVSIDHAGPASDGTTTGARITSALGLAAVFESLAKQLRDAGWTAKTSASSAGLQSQTFAKTVDGTPYVALLSIHALDATHYVALADVSNLGQ